MLRSLHFITLVLAVAIGVSLPLTARAEGAGMFAPDRVGRWYGGGGLGGFSEESNFQLGNEDGRFGNFISGGYRLGSWIALEADGLISLQEVDAPSTIFAPTSRTDLTTAGIGAVVKFILPMDRVEIYAGGGLGVYTSRIRTETAIGDIERDDTDIGYQALAGLDVFVSRRVSLGLEYRKFKLDANFGPTIPGKLEVGGDFFFATVRGHF